MVVVVGPGASVELLLIDLFYSVFLPPFSPLKLSRHYPSQMDPQAPKKRGRKPKPKEDRKEEQKMRDSKRSQQQSIDDKYTQWKSLVPVLYDWLANHNLVWPSLSCRLFSHFTLLGFH